MTRRLDIRNPALWRLLFAGLLLAVLARLAGLGDALSALATLDARYIPAVLALFGLGQVLSCLRWRLALMQIVARPPGLATLLRLYLAGMFVNLGLPMTTGGDILRAELTHRLVGARGGAYASIVADRLIGVLAVVLVAAAALLLAAPMVEPGARRLVVAAALGLPAALAVLLAALRAGAGRLEGTRIAPFVGALRTLSRRPAILALSLAIAVVVQAGGVVLPTALLAVAMGIDVPLVAHFALVPIVVLATVVPLAPNGLGVRETAFVLLYGQLGVGSGQAFALGLCWSLVLIAYGLAGGIALVQLRRRATPEH